MLLRCSGEVSPGPAGDWFAAEVDGTIIGHVCLAMSMAEFFQARIVHVYLVYGLGFFTLGLAVALEAGRTSESRLALAMRSLAVFGLLHGFHEWVEMFELVGAAAYGFVTPLWLDWGRLGLLAVSFAALIAFGVGMLYSPPGHQTAGVRSGLGMLTLSAAGALALGIQLQGDDWALAADAWARYSLGVPGALLAAGALRAEWRLLRQTELAPFANHFLWAAIVLAVYGLVGQTAVPRSQLFPSNIYNAGLFSQWFGFPIQALRAVLAALMAFFVIRGLRTFEVERQRRLAAAQQQAQEAIARRDALRGELLRRTVAAQEEERARLARELHDDTLQVFTGLSAGLVGTQQQLAASPEKAREQLTQLAAMSSHAIAELRRLIRDLRPSVLDDMGLVPAVHSYLEAMRERLPPDVTVTAEGLESRLPAPVETTLFRIAQEGLTNVARHAGAHRVALRLSCDQVTARLEIEDDGAGFDAAAALRSGSSPAGWGLAGIQERAELAGGEFKIVSAPGKGTVLSVALPARLSEGQDDGGHTG